MAKTVTERDSPWSAAAAALGRKRWANVSHADRLAAAMKLVAARRKKRRTKRPREKAVP